MLWKTESKWRKGLTISAENVRVGNGGVMSPT